MKDVTSQSVVLNNLVVVFLSICFEVQMDIGMPRMANTTAQGNAERMRPRRILTVNVCATLGLPIQVKDRAQGLTWFARLCLPAAERGWVRNKEKIKGP